MPLWPSYRNQSIGSFGKFWDDFRNDLLQLIEKKNQNAFLKQETLYLSQIDCALGDSIMNLGEQS